MKLRKFIKVPDDATKASMFWEIEPAVKEPLEYGLHCREIRLAHDGDDFVNSVITCLMTFENEMSEN